MGKRRTIRSGFEARVRGLQHELLEAQAVISAAQGINKHLREKNEALGVKLQERANEKHELVTINSTLIRDINNMRDFMNTDIRSTKERIYELNREIDNLLFFFDESFSRQFSGLELSAMLTHKLKLRSKK